MTRTIDQRPVADGNWRRGRAGRKPDVIVIHISEGTEASARAWFNDPDAGVSTHYLVAKDGSIDRFVAEEDTAFGNGRVDRPTAQLVRDRPGVNPNLYTISIEHEGDGNDTLTPAQFSASGWLIEGIAARWGIPLDRTHVIGHREIFAAKACPRKISVDALLAEAKSLRVPPPAPVRRPPPPRVVWSPYFADWLVVTRFVSDVEWYFIPARRLAAGMPAETKAQTPYSQMT